MNGRQRWLHAPVVKCVPIDDVSIAVVDEVVVALREWSGTSKSVQCENATNIWTTSGNRRVRKRLVQHMQTNEKTNAYLAILSVFPLTHSLHRMSRCDAPVSLTIIRNSHMWRFLHCEPKKHAKYFCHIFHKTQSSLIKFGTHCPCDTVV